MVVCSWSLRIVQLMTVAAEQYRGVGHFVGPGLNFEWGNFAFQVVVMRRTTPAPLSPTASALSNEQNPISLDRVNTRSLTTDPQLGTITPFERVT